MTDFSLCGENCSQMFCAWEVFVGHPSMYYYHSIKMKVFFVWFFFLMFIKFKGKHEEFMNKKRVTRHWHVGDTDHRQLQMGL